MNLYRLKLTSLSPLHIGSGNDFVPTSYIIDEGYLYEFDEISFFHELPAELKRSFTNIASQGIIGIKKFYQNEKELAKSISFKKVAISKSIEDRYNRNTNKDGSKNQNQLEVAKTMTMPNSYLPYIPGSSFKGVIESALGNYIHNFRTTIHPDNN